jgi:hypothetical protein
MASDDELPYFLLPDDLTGNKNIRHVKMPKVFEGSLKDYQGLEGVSILCLQFIHLIPSQSNFSFMATAL